MESGISRNLSFDASQESCERGAQWCLDLQQPDGSIRMPARCFDAIYKFPAALVVTGRYVEAAKLLNWLENETLTTDGDFRFPERKHLYGWFDCFYTYTNSWIAIAAQRAGFFKLADRAVTYLLRYQNSRTGALQSRAIETDKTGCCDTAITSQGGICFLYTGHHEEAIKAADALCRIAEMHDNQSDQFLFRTDRNGKLITTPLADENNVDWIRVDRTKDNQLYYYLGIAGAFLCHAYELTGKTQYLESAEKYAGFLLECKGSLRSLAAGKFGYCLALLYRSTGNERYWDAATEYIGWLLEMQRPDGQWRLDDWGERHWYFCYDCTAEFVYWISEMAKLLASPRQVH
jgi:rhamnogalacturonyl hydrolase YesR